MEEYTQKIIETLNSVNESGKYIWILEMAKSSSSLGRVKVDGKEYTFVNEGIPSPVFDVVVHEEIPVGIYLFVYEDGHHVETQYISHYNTNLFRPESLALYQVFGLEPADDGGKKRLEEDIKAEKIKETLVYYCYENAPEKIKKWLEKPKKTQLNATMCGYGTPLIICTLNNDLESFKGIVEAGADLNKKSLGKSPLEFAMRYSSDIVRYIYENHREQFDKEVKRRGFLIGSYCQDTQILDLLREYGCDMNCEGEQAPPFHCFVDADNVVGIKYLIDHGISKEILNKAKQTPLERAKRQRKEKVIALLEEK